MWDYARDPLQSRAIDSESYPNLASSPETQLGELATVVFITRYERYYSTQRGVSPHVTTWHTSQQSQRLVSQQNNTLQFVVQNQAFYLFIQKVTVRHLRKLTWAWPCCSSGISLLQLRFNTAKPRDHMLTWNTLEAASCLQRWLGLESASANSFLTLAHPWTSVQKKAMFPPNGFAQGGILIPDLIKADSEHEEWLI